MATHCAESLMRVGLSGVLLFFYQLGYGRSDLRALADPVVQAVGLQAYALLFFVGNGVVKAYALNETAVAAGAAVGYYDVVERAFFGTAAGQTDNYHENSFEKIVNLRNRAF